MSHYIEGDPGKVTSIVLHGSGITTNNNDNVLLQTLADFVKQCTYLREFKLNHVVSVSAERWFELISALESRQHLEILDVSRNCRLNGLMRMTSSGRTNTIFQSNLLSNIRILDLSNSWFQMPYASGREFIWYFNVTKVTQFLRQTRTLETLRMKDCVFDIDDSKILLMEKGIAKNCSIKYLEMDSGWWTASPKRSFTLMNECIAKNPTIQEVTGCCDNCHIAITRLRHKIRTPLLDKLDLLSATRYISPEMINVVGNYMDVPVAYAKK